MSNSKINLRESNIPKILINDKMKNIFTEELMKTNESIDVIQNKSFISTDKDNLNKHTNYKHTDLSNNTTLYLVNNFKEGKEINQTTDVCVSQFSLNNKTNFMNSFDIDQNEDENFSFDLINLYEFGDADQNNKNEGLKINSICDKRNDVSAINHDNDNIGYLTSNILLDRTGGFLISNEKFFPQSNLIILENIEELDIYLKKIIEYSLNTNEKNNKLGNQSKIFDCTMKTIKLDFFDNINNEYNRIQIGKRKSFEIIDPEQFSIFTDYLYNEINQKTIDLSERYKNSRRKVFDENYSKRNEYISLIKEYMLKKVNIFSEVCREFISKLNISKKILFETFVFFIFKKNYTLQGHSNYHMNYEENIFPNNNINKLNDSLIESIFNCKKFEKYMKLFTRNSLFDKLAIDNIDEIIYSITRLNYVGIKE